MSQQDKKSETFTLTGIFALAGAFAGTAFAQADQGFAAGAHIGRHVQALIAEQQAKNI